MSAQSIAVRYLLVELPLSDGSDPLEDNPEVAHQRIANDVSEFLWEDPSVVDSPRVTLIYPGDVVPGGEPDEDFNGHCDTCGSRCDKDGCTADRSHVAAIAWEDTK